MAPSFILLLLVNCIVLLTAEKSPKKSTKHVVTEEVYFDIIIQDYEDREDFHGRFVVALFGDIVPSTVLNFKSLVKGFRRPSMSRTLHYKNTPIHRIVPDFILQMGDVTNLDGTGGASIYGSTFMDENFELSHRSAGFLSMANQGPDTNASQFFVLLNKSRWLDGKHVVFGKIVRGMDVIRTIEEVSVVKGTSDPTKKIKVEDCGIVGIPDKYTLTEEEVDSNDDIQM